MVSPLNLKLWRDLKRLKGQVAAISLVIAMGVMMLVMMTGLVTSLELTRKAYYESYRLADVFASVVRAPKSVIKELENIDGVNIAEGRILGDALVDIRGNDNAYRAMAISLPDNSQPKLNQIRLLKGRIPMLAHSTEIVLLNSFAAAHDLNIGDSIEATLYGKRRELNIVGIAQSPEFLYTTAPGELVPADGRFAVFWLVESEMAAVFDMDGAVNQFILSVPDMAQLDRILFSVDSILKPFGGLGAYGLDQHHSNKFVSEEIAGLKASSVSVPPVFMFVAAFLLYMVTGRMVQAEREQIGLLKSFGYSNFEVNKHYLKLAVVISLLGALLGSALGIWAGHGMTVFYQVFFKFPFIIFQLDASSFIKGLVISVSVASMGSVWALRNVYDLTPAVAMQPPVPADYSHLLTLPGFVLRKLDTPSRMLWRRLVRQPGRFINGSIGIAFGMALSVSMVAMLHGFQATMDTTFNQIDRSDATVSFINAVSKKSVYELEKIEGVLTVEPFRVVPVVFKNGLYQYRGAVNGYVSQPELNRALDANGKPLVLDNAGVVLSKAVAKILNVSVGDVLLIEVKEGHRPSISVPVSGIAETLLGSPVYMELSALNRYLKEQGRVSGAFLKLDATKETEVYKTLKLMPKVAGVGLKKENEAAFKKLLDSGAGAMRYIMLLIAGVISFGIVYNSACTAYSERLKELASMRVLGFEKSEANFVLLAELAVIVILALPIGAVLGQLLSHVIAESFSTDIYQIPVIYSPQSFGLAGAAVLIASFVSAYVVKRDADKLDLVIALKHKE